MKEFFTFSESNERIRNREKKIHARDPRDWKNGDEYDRMEEMAAFNQEDREVYDRDLAFCEQETLNLMHESPVGKVIHNEYTRIEEDGYEWTCITDHGDFYLYTIEKSFGDGDPANRYIVAVRKDDPAVENGRMEQSIMKIVMERLRGLEKIRDEYVEAEMKKSKTEEPEKHDAHERRQQVNRVEQSVEWAGETQGVKEIAR